MAHGNDNNETENLNVIAEELLPTPDQVKQLLPLSATATASVQAGRRQVRAILERRDPRLIVVVGPCSIHDLDAAHEYGEKLRALQSRVGDTLCLIMRVYFEKPRTTIGWKGLINDPYLNDSFHIEDGLKIARRLLIDLAESGLALSTEALDPISPQYIHDLITWSAIGARTTESQTHREMASGLSSAVGFKNGTDGGLEVAINALQSAANPHRFLGIDQRGQVAVIQTRGNDLAHVVLRGGSLGPNFEPQRIAECEAALQDINVRPNIVVDCSHDNSGKDHTRQAAVATAVAAQIAEGNNSIMGIMLESNLNEGKQKLVDRDQLKYGVSITDGCIGWGETEDLLVSMAEQLRDPLVSRLRLAEVS